MENYSEETETRGIALLLTIADANQEALVEAGIDPTTARAAALRAAERMRHDHGGTQLYIPKGAVLELAERDWAIWQEYNGSNIPALAKKYDRTERAIYMIIARCRVEHDRKNQLALFG